MDKLPWGWIFWGAIALIAVRLLLNQIYALRNHLRVLLIEHFKSQIEEAKKRQNILRMQTKIRERNERAEAERMAREENASETNRSSRRKAA